MTLDGKTRAPTLILVCGLLVCGLLALGTVKASSEVRFGKNVRIGGHDFSNRSYRRVNIETTNRRPPWYGCRIFPAGSSYQGKRLASRTEICNLKQIPYGARR